MLRNAVKASPSNREFKEKVRAKKKLISTYDNCAKDFAPGQEAEDPTGAEDFAPGHVDEVNPILEPKDDAPGQFNKKPIPE
jgi:hypothetical protein